MLTTLGSEEEAARMVRVLVEERLVACGTIVPGARSIYRWEGAVEDAREVLVLLKTVAGREVAAAQRLRELHPYAVPEILVGRAGAPNLDYARWVVESTRAASPPPETS